MRFFGLKSCDTCRKALKMLADDGQTPDVIDVRADGLDAADIEEIVSQFGDTAINRASTTWRALSDAEKEGDAAALLAAYPTLMKRPIMHEGKHWTIGWKAEVQKQWLGKAG